MKAVRDWWRMSATEQDPKPGVDLTLIRWMLSLTPAERLKVAEDYISDIEVLRNARQANRQPKGAGRS
jgi:hypothetical protein